MAYRANTAKSTVYPKRVCETTAHRLAVTARGLRLHAAGPRTGGDGAAAPRPLRQLRRLLLASPRSNSLPSAGGRTEHVDADEDRGAQHVRDGAAACGRSSG